MKIYACVQVMPMGGNLCFIVKKLTFFENRKVPKSFQDGVELVVVRNVLLLEALGIQFDLSYSISVQKGI